MSLRRTTISLDGDDVRRLLVVLEEATRQLPTEGTVADELRVALGDLRLRLLVARSKLRGEVHA